MSSSGILRSGHAPVAPWQTSGVQEFRQHGRAPRYVLPHCQLRSFGRKHTRTLHPFLASLRFGACQWRTSAPCSPLCLCITSLRNGITLGTAPGERICQGRQLYKLPNIHRTRSACDVANSNAGEQPGSSRSPDGGAGSSGVPGSSGAPGVPQPGASGQPKAYALPFGLKPYHYVSLVGLARIICVLHAPVASYWKAPFSNVLGPRMAVAVSMLAFGGVLLKVGQIVVDNKVHETLVGQVCIWLGCFALAVLCFVLASFCLFITGVRVQRAHSRGLSPRTDSLHSLSTYQEYYQIAGLHCKHGPLIKSRHPCDVQPPADPISNALLCSYVPLWSGPLGHWL
jgi:hypothetical protein